MADGFGVSALDDLARTAVHDVVDDGCAGISGDIGCTVDVPSLITRIFSTKREVNS